MQISYNWLKKYIPLEIETAKLQDILTFSGIEVEAVRSLKQLPSGVISAKIISASPVPNSDHLQVCRVFTGSEELQVVCGAKNCRPQMTAILATPGTDLGVLKIKKTTIRGVDSYGMLCSEAELGISDNHDGIIELSDDIPAGKEANELFELPDTVFELEITPNRSDLLGYLGIARDLSSATGIAICIPVETEHTYDGNIADQLDVKILNAELCPRYTARLIKGIKVAPSPLWLQNALIKSGLRPINNVVDITNYVMLESGHPLHAFDFDKLSGDTAKKQIIVRNATEGETIKALDSKSYTLRSDDLVIADANNPIAIAGVIGGANSHITDDTVDIVLESAAFHPGSVRRTSYFHKINTDSSYRFERHLSEYSPEYAGMRAASLILEMAGGTLCEGVLDVWPQPGDPITLSLRPKRFEKIIGYSLSDEQICGYLSRLGLEAIKSEHGLRDESERYLSFKIPHYRLDLEREIDLIEELARLDGYDKIPQKTFNSSIMDRSAHALRRKIQDLMVTNGCYEALTFSFEDPSLIERLGFDATDMRNNPIKLKNPQSAVFSVMRTTLLPQLLKAMVYNLNHGHKDVRLFELNKTYFSIAAGEISEPYKLCTLLTGRAESEHYSRKQTLLDFAHVKGLADQIIHLLGLPHPQSGKASLAYFSPNQSMSYVFGEKELISFGKLRPEIASAFGIDVIEMKQDVWLLEAEITALLGLVTQDSVTFCPISKFPEVERDLSFIISEDVPWIDIQKQIMAIDPTVIKDVILFDEYRGKQVPEGYRSLSVHILLCDSEKTLTVIRIDELVASVQKMLLEKWQIKMR